MESVEGVGGTALAGGGDDMEAGELDAYDAALGFQTSLLAK